MQSTRLIKLQVLTYMIVICSVSVLAIAACIQAWSKYQGHTVYGPNSPLFEITYNPEMWFTEKDDRSGGDRLVNRQEPTCYLVLQEGAREYVSLGQIKLGNYVWGIVETTIPDYFVYIANDKLDAFIFGLQLPDHVSEEARTTCNRKLEAILTTFKVVKR